MLRELRHWLYRPPVRMWPVDNSRIRTTCTKNAQFISYLVESGFRKVNVDRYEVSRRPCVGIPAERNARASCSGGRHELAPVNPLPEP